MSPETNYTSPTSLNEAKPPRAPEVPIMPSTSKTSHRYSSPVNQGVRHYASPEESDAVFPVFSTPTHMYILQELNPQPKGSPLYTSSPKQPAQYSPTQQKQTYSGTSSTQNNTYFDPIYSKSPGSPLAQQNQYGRTRGESSPARPNMDNMEHGVSSTRNSYTATPNVSPSLAQKDMLLAQLIDMGFSLEASQVAIAASGGTNLQEILDILVQNSSTETPPHRPTPEPSTSQPPPSRSNHASPPSRENHAPPPSRENHAPPPSRENHAPPPSRNNIPPRSNHPPPPKSSDDEDEREQEERFRREQEERHKEYLDQLKREKPTPPIPSPRPPPTTFEPISVFADNERKQGNYLFNKGQFTEAESAYSVAIDALPAGHSELVLLCNNRAAARLKLGKYQECITDCSQAIDIARNQMEYSTDVTWKAQLIKALHRKASALEGLCLFEKAIQVYEEYIRLDGSRSAQVSQGIMRCQQALLEKRQPPPQPPRPSPNWKPANDNSAFPDIDFNMFIPKQTSEQKANFEEINKSKAVKEVRDREKKKEAEDTERLMNQDKVDAKISVWKTGKDRNLRALLGSLELILWPGVQWKGVTMSELLEPRKCKITYMKAIAKVHPDKLPANSTIEQRMLASSIFTTLNQAWDLFKAENRL